eukprot:2956414-Amphidinium_carterae.2
MKQWQDLQHGVTCTLGWRTGQGPYVEHTWKAFLFEDSLRWTLQFILPAWGIVSTSQRPASRHLADRQKSFLSTLAAVGMELNQHYGTSMLALQRGAASDASLTQASQSHWLSTEGLLAFHAYRVSEKITRKVADRVAIRASLDHWLERCVSTSYYECQLCSGEPPLTLPRCCLESHHCAHVQTVVAKRTELAPETPGHVALAGLLIDVARTASECCATRAWLQALVTSVGRDILESHESWARDLSRLSEVAPPCKKRRTDEHIKHDLITTKVCEGKFGTSSASLKAAGVKFETGRDWMLAEVSAYRSCTWQLGNARPKHLGIAADGFRIGTPGKEYLVLAFTLPQQMVSGVLPPQVPQCNRQRAYLPRNPSTGQTNAPV